MTPGATLHLSLKKGNRILLGDREDAVKFKDVIFNLSATLLTASYSIADSKSEHLYGFNFIDLVTIPGGKPVMKDIIMKSAEPWLELANLVDAVILCGEIGEVIRSGENKSREKPISNTLPSNKHLLACLVPVLQFAARKSHDPTTALRDRPGVKILDKAFLAITRITWQECSHHRDEEVNTC
jgi:hypothetical protein